MPLHRNICGSPLIVFHSKVIPPDKNICGDFFADLSETSFTSYLDRGSESRSVCIPARFATIAKRCLLHCSSVAFVTFESNCPVVQLANELFARCPVRSIVGLTSVEVLGKQGCYHCHELASVLFEAPSRLHRIDTEAFADCFSLTTIRIPAAIEILGSRGFPQCRLLGIAFDSGPYASVI
jgi:hypothetical protein